MNLFDYRCLDAARRGCGQRTRHITPTIMALCAAALFAGRSAECLAEEPFFTEATPVSAAEAGIYPSLSPLVRKLSASVVNISGELVDADQPGAEGEQREEKGPGGRPNPFFRGPGQPRSLGSGFIVNSAGFIVTNLHVIEKSNRIIVRLLDDKGEYEARIVGADKKTDLALLKVDVQKPLPAVTIGDSERLEVGDPVIAIGNQFQLGQTVTSGIVSATSRRLPTSSPYDAFIQTDAVINPGSSGGPLFNTHGEVVGINTAIFSPARGQFGGSGFNIGIGFAIPINLAKEIIVQLREHQKVTRGLLGVVVQRIEIDTAEALNLESPYGALVADVIPNSPAMRAGFRRKDVIIAFNGTPVREQEELPLLVARTRVGSTVPIDAIRDGKKITLQATITELTEIKGDGGPKPAQERKSDRLGLTTAPIDDELKLALRLKESDGVVVLDVERGSVGDQAGFERGDIIEELHDKRVFDIEAYDRLVAALPSKKNILALVRKSEGTRFLTIKLR